MADPAPATIGFWHVDLGIADPQAAGLLAPEELRRADAFHADLHRSRFIVGRAALRRILAARLGAEPAALALATGRAGKPFLVDADGAPVKLPFNLSHSDDHMLCAVGEGGDLAEIGVDIERVRADIAVMGIGARVFAPAECAALSRCTDAARADLFASLWTRKEACIKATGEGVSAPLRAFAVATEAGELLAIVDAATRIGVTRRLRLATLVAAAGYAAAIAVEGGPFTIVPRRYPDGIGSAPRSRVA